MLVVILDQQVEEVTWEIEEMMKSQYPYSFQMEGKVNKREVGQEEASIYASICIEMLM